MADLSSRCRCASRLQSQLAFLADTAVLWGHERAGRHRSVIWRCSAALAPSRRLEPRGCPRAVQWCPGRGTAAVGDRPQRRAARVRLRARREGVAHLHRRVFCLAIDAPDLERAWDWLWFPLRTIVVVFVAGGAGKMLGLALARARIMKIVAEMRLIERGSSEERTYVDMHEVG